MTSEEYSLITDDIVNEYINGDRGYAKVATDHGISPWVFREYLAEHNIIKASKTANKKTSLCFLCKRSHRFMTYPCPWAIKFEPVDGWVVEPTVIRYKNDDRSIKIESFLVIGCPLYIEDRRK